MYIYIYTHTHKYIYIYTKKLYKHMSIYCYQSKSKDVSNQNITQHRQDTATQTDNPPRGGAENSRNPTDKQAPRTNVKAEAPLVLGFPIPPPEK